MEEKHQLIAQPGHKLAVPLFSLTALLYLGIVAFEYFTNCCHTFDQTFAWFGGFYIVLSGLYFLAKMVKRA
ncbi:MAG: hypothetical protein HWE21_11125 [Cytophagia bacterium]|nr:hypothetical protein [Cytophagia bacterium]NVK84865.1 hypothetical protein [Cytophagia bacterium]